MDLDWYHSTSSLRIYDYLVIHHCSSPRVLYIQVYKIGKHVDENTKCQLLTPPLPVLQHTLLDGKQNHQTPECNENSAQLPVANIILSVSE